MKGCLQFYMKVKSALEDIEALKYTSKILRITGNLHSEKKCQIF